MGRGNWTPTKFVSNPGTFSNQVYVDLGSEEEDYDDTGSYGELKECIEQALSSPTWDPPSFLELSRHYSRDTKVLFCNQHVLVVWDTQGESHHQGVGVVVNPDAYQDGFGGLAERTAALTFDRILKALCDTYGRNVSYRTSAWTSTPVLPTPFKQMVV